VQYASPPAPDLSALRDIHLPDPVGLWPPSGTLLLLLGLLIIGAIALYYLFRRYLKQSALKRIALKRLVTIRASSRSQVAQVNELANLTRRVALSRFPSDEVAPLTGEAWLTFLDHRYDETGRANLFREGVGQWLGDRRYLPDTKIEQSSLNELYLLVKQWIERVC